MDRVKGGDVNVVAAYDLSRAFRNTSDVLDFYSLMEKRSEIEVVFVHGRFDRSPAGEFTYTTLAAAHAMERRMTGEKIRDAYRSPQRRHAGMAFSESRRRGGRGRLIPAAWPALVSDSLWKTAHAVSDRRHARGGRRRPGEEMPYVFKGLLRCSCGERLHGAGKTRAGRLYYACRHGHEKLVACSERWVREEEITPWARALLVALESLKPRISRCVSIR